MVIQTDVYPGVGYVGYPQQQGYVMHQQSQYPTNVYYSRVSGTQMVPILYTTSPQYPNHHRMFYGGHNQNEGWKDMNKHQDGWCSESGHQGVGYDSNDQKQENWIEMNKQDGWYGGSGHPGLGYDSIDPSKFSQVGKVPSNGRRVQHDQAVPSNGYGVYHDQTVPSNGYGAPATWGSDQPYPSQGYQTVEYWAIKGYGAPATWGSDQPYPSQGYQTVEYWAIKGFSQSKTPHEIDAFIYVYLKELV